MQVVNYGQVLHESQLNYLVTFAHYFYYEEINRFMCFCGIAVKFLSERSL
jgi:hypothetical protein